VTKLHDLVFQFELGNLLFCTLASTEMPTGGYCKSTKPISKRQLLLHEKYINALIKAGIPPSCHAR